MKSILKISCWSTAIFLSLASNSIMAQEYYKWVDQKGTTHYTKTPPPANATKKKGKVDTYGWKNSAPATTNTPAENQNQQKSPPEVPATNSSSSTGSPVAEK